MKKLLLPAVVFLLSIGGVHAQTTRTFKPVVSPKVSTYIPPGGLSPNTAITGLGWEQSLGDLATAAHSIQQVNQVNLPGGVAGLDSNGYVTAPVIISVAGGPTRVTSNRMADYVNVKDFGAKGDALALNTTSLASTGSNTISVTDGSQLTVGMTVHGMSLQTFYPAFTYVTAITGNTVTLSASSLKTIPVGTILDFGGTDDSAAISASSTYACATHTGLFFPPGRYYAPSAVYGCKGLYVSFKHASLDSESTGVPSVPDQSQVFSLSGETESGELMNASTQNVSYIAGMFVASNSTNSYQHNVQSITGRNNDPYLLYTKADGSTGLATHDAVGQFITMSQASTNTFGNTWDWNHVLSLEAGSNGSAVIGEAEITNTRTTVGSDFDGSNTVGGYDEIYNCHSQCLYAHFFQNGSNSQPGLTNGLVFRRGTVSNIALGQLSASYPDASGVTSASGHVTDWAIYANGMGFFNTLHIGGGAAFGDVIPTSGFNVYSDGTINAPTVTTPSLVSNVANATTALNLGDSSSGFTPYIQFNMQGSGGAGTTSLMRIIASQPNTISFTYGTGVDLMDVQRSGIYINVPLSTNGGPLSVGPLTIGSFSMNNLPTGVVVGTKVWCYNCYSQAPLQYNYNTAGVELVWSGNAWVDPEGYPYGSTPSPPYLKLRSLTKAQILALSGMTEGSVVQDSDDHAAAIYENGSWHLVTLGATLQ